MVKISFEDTPLSTAPTRDETPLRLTDEAAKRVMAILAKKDDTAYLRVSVNGGGCNGYSYKFEVVNEKATDDHVVVNENFPSVEVLVNELSAHLMMGSVLDYEDTLVASQFVIKNPNAKSHCGCGNSFGV